MEQIRTFMSSRTTKCKEEPWMASESFLWRFSEKTDMWSYGIMMWEIFTLCKCQPYKEMEDQEIIQDAIKGDGRIGQKHAQR